MEAALSAVAIYRQEPPGSTVSSVGSAVTAGAFSGVGVGVGVGVGAFC